MGINPDDVITLLKGATSRRLIFEEWLASRQPARDEEKHARAERRLLQRAFKQAKPLIDFFKREGFFAHLATEIEAGVHVYAEEFLFGGHSSDPAHRPGEPWSKTFILKLATLFKDHEVPPAHTIKQIYRALELAGHGDVITQEHIRHIIYPRKKSKKRK